MTTTFKDMTIHTPPDETDADNHKPAQEMPEASSSMASRVMAIEDALMELIKITSVHTEMLKDLQAANAALAKQLEANQARLDQLDVTFCALLEAQASKPLSKGKFDPDTTANDLQLLGISSSAKSHTLANASMPHHNPSNTLIPGCTEFRSVDMSNLATTLALVPQASSNTSPASSRSSSFTFQERRKYKPHRFVRVHEYYEFRANVLQGGARQALARHLRQQRWTDAQHSATFSQP